MYTRYLRTTGDSFSRGLEIGKNLKLQIETNYVNLKRHYQVNFSDDFDLWCEECVGYLPMIEKYAPDTLEEIKGMAEGSGFALEKILAITTAYEKSLGSKLVSDKCTSFSATGKATVDGYTICGQTNDERMDEFPPYLDLVIHHKDADGHEMMIYTHPGIPAYMGCNNQGIAILWTYIDNGSRGFGVPTNIIIREALSKKSYEEAVKYIEELPHAVPNYFKVCHKEHGATGLECFPNKVYKQIYGDISVHSNHNIICGDNEREMSVSWSTKHRYANMEKQLMNNFGKIDASVAENFFRDHTEFPYSICVHPCPQKPTGKTLAAMVFELNNGTMHIAFGNPCEVPYFNYRFDQYK